jgi:hypothetical protein
MDRQTGIDRNMDNIFLQMVRHISIQRQTNGQTDRWRDRQVGGWTDKEMNSQMNRHKDRLGGGRETDKQMDRKTNKARKLLILFYQNIHKYVIFALISIK